MYNEQRSQTYTSPNQVKKVLAFGLLSAFTAVPLVNVEEDILEPLRGSIFGTIADGLSSLISLVLNKALLGIFDLVGWIFTGVTEYLLIVDPPGTMDSITGVWLDFFPIYWALMPVAGAVFFLGLQLFPQKEEVSIYRFMERFFISVVALIATAPVWNVEGEIITITDGFSAAVIATNGLIRYVGPESYSLSFLGGALNQMTGALIGGGIVIGVIIAALLVGVKFLLSALIVVGTFWLVLAMRMLLIYVVYAMMPLLLALWVVDVGPLKYGKMVAEMIFKVTAVLLLLGVIIAGILRTTGAIAGGSSGAGANVTIAHDINASDDPTNYTDVEEEEGTQDPDVDVGEAAVNITNNSVVIYNEEERIGGRFQSGIENSDTPPGGFKLALLQIVAWFGGISLAIALTTSLLGMILTTRGPSGTSSRMRQGRSGDAPGGTQVLGGGGGAAAGSAGGGNTVVTQTDDGSTIIENPNSDESMIIGEDGSVSTFSPDEVDEDGDGLDAVPLTDKAKHLSDKYGGKAKDVASKANEDIEDVTGRNIGEKGKEAMERGGEMKDSVTEPVSDRVSEASETARDYATEKAEEYPRAGKVAGAGLRAGMWAGKSSWKGMKKAPGLMKRGGKAYWQAYKQPTVAGTIGEIKRMAKESEIGHPDAPEGGDNDPSEDFNDFYGGFDSGDPTGNFGGSTGNNPTGDGNQRTTGSGDTTSSGSTGSGGSEDAFVTGEENDELNVADGSDALNELDEDDRFDLQGVEFQEEGEFDVSNNDDEEFLMQTGYFKDPESGERIEHVGFGDNAGLEDGETYDVQGAKANSFTAMHDKKTHRDIQADPRFGEAGESEYMQAEVDDQTSVRKASERPTSGGSTSGGDVGGGSDGGGFDVSDESAEAFGEMMSTDMSGRIHRSGDTDMDLGGIGQRRRTLDGGVTGESLAGRTGSSPDDSDWSPDAEANAGYAQIDHQMDDGVPPASSDINIPEEYDSVVGALEDGVRMGSEPGEVGESTPIDMTYDSDRDGFESSENNVYRNSNEVESHNRPVNGATPPSTAESDVNEIDDLFTAEYNESGGVYESDGGNVPGAGAELEEGIEQNGDSVNIQSSVTKPPGGGDDRVGGYRVVDATDDKKWTDGGSVSLADKSDNGKVRVEGAEIDRGEKGVGRLRLTDETRVKGDVGEDAKGRFEYGDAAE